MVRNSNLQIFTTKSNFFQVFLFLIIIESFVTIGTFAISIPIQISTPPTATVKGHQIGQKCGSFITERSPRNLSGIDIDLDPTTICDPEVPLECAGGRCQCKRGYTLNRNETKCLEIARNGLESPCEENIQCWKGLPGRLSECSASDRKCRCYESETLPIVFHQGRCYYGESLGDYCQIEGLCAQTTGNATCRSGTCQCREGHVPSWDKSRCLQIATQGLNSSCEENIQCEKSALGTLSECNQDTLQCQCYRIPAMVPTVFYSGRCYFGASLGDVCQVAAQCEAKTANSMCGLDGKCVCREDSGGFVSNRNGTACLPLATELAESAAAPECLEDVQCIRTLGHFARCDVDKGKCECLPPTPADTDGVSVADPMVIIGARCHSTRQIGYPCKYNQQCSAVTENARCLGGTGVCGCDEMTHVVSADGRRCLEIGKDGFGSHCEEDQQCMKSILGPLSMCERKKEDGVGVVTGTCRCSALLPVVFFEKTCFFQRQLGALCDSDLECKAGLGGEFSGCIGGRCQCENGTVDHQHSCTQLSVLVSQGQPEPISSSSFIQDGAFVAVLGIVLLCFV